MKTWKEVILWIIVFVYSLKGFSSMILGLVIMIETSFFGGLLVMCLGAVVVSFGKGFLGILPKREVEVRL